jgi:hypothetical protein
VIVGFTGTRLGMRYPQAIALLNLLEGFPASSEFHHGDCLGSDFEFHLMCEYKVATKIVVHPPLEDRWRAFCDGDVILEPDSYLKRNIAIVKACDLLIVCPEGKAKLRSGTWHTVSQARLRKLPHVIIWPDGTIERMNGA